MKLEPYLSLIMLLLITICSIFLIAIGNLFTVPLGLALWVFGTAYVCYKGLIPWDKERLAKKEKRKAVK